jgi:hypothetical protein
MVAQKPMPARKFFTVQQANSALPLVRAIVADITKLAHELRERHERLGRGAAPRRGALSDAHEEELRQAQEEFDQARERMRDYEHELEQLGVELKDYFTGLIDFPARLNGRPVYLCWRLGEPEVAHWHELEAGFAGRQPLTADAVNG